MLSDPRQSQKVLEMERFYFCRNIIKSRGEEMGLRGDSWNRVRILKLTRLKGIELGKYSLFDII